MSKVSVKHYLVPSCAVSPFRRRLSRLVTRLMALGMVAGSASAIQAQYYKAIYNFGSGSDPSCPNSAPLTQTPGGKLIGTADSSCQGGQNGAAFEIGYQGANFMIVQSFGTTMPSGGLTLGTDQRFHGTTNLGGSRNHGTVYRLSTSPSITYEHDFLGGADGGYPGAPPIQSSTGDWYGTTGGSASAYAGTVYKITAAGHYSVLHLFSTTDGRGPECQLLEASDGNLYGTTTSGGQYGVGTIFRISPTGDFKSLYSFDGPHGQFPVGSLIQASDGNIYGATVEGGSLNQGTAFKMTLDGTVSLFYDFSATSSQANEPGGGLLEATDGNFYGALQSGGFNGDGAIYQLTKAGVFKVVHPFYGFTGSVPQSTLMQHTSGILYGTTVGGGNYGRGVIFELNMGLSPFITYLPVYGQVGATVDILGEYFTSTSTVYFNGVPAVSPKISSTYIEATVPEGATTGNITVTTSKGTLTSNKPFVVH
jgi:uncharacterized repeat protein (TIGR03803 family)